MEHYNKFSQIIPSQKEVADYFKLNGNTQEEAFFWFNSMDRKEWKDSKGKRIKEWSKIAWLKIQDLKAKQQPIVKATANAEKDVCLMISEGIGKLFQIQTGKVPTSYIKVVCELILKIKSENNLSLDIDVIRFVDSKLAECSDWEYDSVKSYLFP